MISYSSHIWWIAILKSLSQMNTVSRYLTLKLARYGDGLGPEICAPPRRYSTMMAVPKHILCNDANTEIARKYIHRVFASFRVFSFQLPVRIGHQMLLA